MSNKQIVVFRSNDLTITSEEHQVIVNSLTTQNPTDAELRVFYYDCARRGVHPLDKLIIFTKRAGRYVPVISIDYARIRAESSGAYAGSDDAILTGQGQYPDTATVTVWKIVQGMRCPFTATARWSQYAPEDMGSKAAFFWRKMPHHMLAKCAEGLALRKAFPGQLQGLYTREEMDQAVTDGDIVDVSQSAWHEVGEQQQEQPQITQETKKSNRPMTPEALRKFVLSQTENSTADCNEERARKLAIKWNNILRHSDSDRHGVVGYLLNANIDSFKHLHEDEIDVLDRWLTNNPPAARQEAAAIVALLEVQTAQEVEQAELFGSDAGIAAVQGA